MRVQINRSIEQRAGKTLNALSTLLHQLISIVFCVIPSRHSVSVRRDFQMIASTLRSVAVAARQPLSTNVSGEIFSTPFFQPLEK